MKNPSADHDLIGRIRDADVTALAELYDAHATRVYSLACRILRNEADAEDVVQEAFLQVWRQAAKFDLARGAVAGWLLTITRSRAIDRLRRRNGRAQREERCENLEELFSAPAAAADQVLIWEESGRVARRAVAALPPAQRVPLELAYFEGLTHTEIADVLCQPLGTVKTRIRIAMQKIRDGLISGAADLSEHEPSPFTVELSEYLARSPMLTDTYRSLEGLRVLVVDDDSETIDLLRTVLESAGAYVMTGRSVSEGVAHLEAAWPDVILADIAMPGEDGYSLLRQARALADRSGQRLSAAAFTALGRCERAAALSAGFAAHIRKPIQPHTLLETVAFLALRESPAG